jgi:hypothetical protein
MTDDFEIARGMAEAMTGDVEDDDQRMNETTINAETAEHAE